MLQIGDYPMVVLAALRAKTSGFETCIATSSSSQDDAIACAANQYDIEVVRGDEDDTLARFVKATETLKNSDVVVRLTGDNVLPDGDLIRCLVAEFELSELPYIATYWPYDGLPYGVRIEVFFASELRKINRRKLNSYDREHVTPAIIREHEAVLPKRRRSHRDLSFVRATIDNIDDYSRVEMAFRSVSDPISVSWTELAENLTRLQPYNGKVSIVSADYRASTAKLILGGAQLGMTYGATNQVGQPSKKVAVDLVRTAAICGVSLVDTARDYGASEEVVGDAFLGGRCNEMGVVTKLSPLRDISNDASDAEVIARVDASVFESCAKLRAKKIDTLMLHRVAHLSEFDGAVLRRLQEHKSLGNIQRLGVSVQSPEEAFVALGRTDIEVMQLPYNLLDHRWRQSGIIGCLETNRPDIEIHVRSVFLQGLLCTTNIDNWPHFGDIAPIEILSRLKELAAEFDRDGVDDLSVAYVRGHDWVGGCVLGVETHQQLERNISLFSNPPLTNEQIMEVRKRLPEVDESFLNPTNWRFG
jgi:spore coat polysaccharide biosynthesis protein SpsF